MAHNKDLIAKKYTAIQSRYNELCLEFEGHQQKEFMVYNQLQNEFYLTHRTLDYIISGEYEKRNEIIVNPNQISIFDQGA